jgi:hypothetical protein
MARKVLKTFKSIIRDAKRRGLIAHNPAAETTNRHRQAPPQAPGGGGRHPHARRDQGLLVDAAGHKERKKARAMKPARQSCLVVIRDLNVAWPPAVIEAATDKLTDPQKADLRHHFRDVIRKRQRFGDSIKLESVFRAWDEAPFHRSADPFRITADIWPRRHRPGTLLHSGGHTVDVHAWHGR